jgi:hypothetical protein
VASEINDSANVVLEIRFALSALFRSYSLERGNLLFYFFTLAFWTLIFFLIVFGDGDRNGK